jgi:serine phosphatase RsbU (regulator of sigma subunit)
MISIEERKFKLSLSITLLLLLASFPFVFIFYLLEKPWVSAILFCVDVLFGIFYLLGKRGSSLAPTLGTFFLANAAAYFFSSILGKETFIHILFFPFAIVPLLIIENRNSILRWFLTGVPIAGYCLENILLVNPFFSDPLTYPYQFQIVHCGVSIATFGILILSIKFLFIESSLVENKLIQTNQQLAEKNQTERELRLKSEEQSAQLAEKDTTNQVLIKQVSSHLDTTQLLVSTLRKSEAALEVSLEETQKEKQEKEAAFEREHALRIQHQEKAIQLDAANVILKRQKKAMHLTEAGKIVQEKMLSLSEPVDYLAVSVAYRASLGVSGDYYGTYRITPNILGVIVADVTGKGVPAALNMTLLYRILSKIFGENTPEFLANPKVVTEALQAALFAEFAFEKCLSFTYIVIDNRTKVMRYVIAGSESMVVIRRKNGNIETLTSNNTSLRLEESDVFEEGHIQLYEGDRLYIVTDGYLEYNRSTGKKIITANDNGTYDFSLFHEMNNSYAPSPELTLAQHSFNWWHSHIMDNNDELPDDTTVVAIEIA